MPTLAAFITDHGPNTFPRCRKNIILMLVMVSVLVLSAYC